MTHQNQQVHVIPFEIHYGPSRSLLSLRFIYQRKLRKWLNRGSCLLLATTLTEWVTFQIKVRTNVIWSFVTNFIVPTKNKAMKFGDVEMT